MGMSTFVVGVQVPDEKYQKMAEVWNACEAAGVSPPKEVVNFFEWGAPDPMGAVVDLEEMEAVTEWHADMEEGFQIELALLPDNITHVRVVNSY